MANITVVGVAEPASGVAIVKLSEVPSGAWRQAFDAYVAWAKGGPKPPGAPGEAGFGTGAIMSDYDVQGDEIRVQMLPGVKYADVEGLVNDAIKYANAVTP